MTIDEKYIKRCIQLASNGLCNAAPNPMVGAVIVHDDRIIGEGYHACCGQGHAEVNAIASVKERELLKEATIYVSLEPCSHYGKTPPCADLIVRTGIPRVVVGCVDPFSKVSGRGIQRLRDAGVEVKVGVLEEECRQLIRRFVTFNLKERPYVTLKWAQSADGFMDVHREGGHAVVLSTPITSAYVHKQRAEHKAILVGRRTALLDNPSLTTRHWYGKNPLRLVIDRQLTLPTDLRLFDGQTETIVFTEQNIDSKAQNIGSKEQSIDSKAQSIDNREHEKESRSNLIYIKLDFGTDILPQIMHVLYERKIQSLLVEGGSQLLQSFIDSGLWDEIYVEHSAKELRDGVKSPVIPHGFVSEFTQRDHITVSHYQK